MSGLCAQVAACEMNCAGGWAKDRRVRRTSGVGGDQGEDMAVMLRRSFLAGAAASGAVLAAGCRAPNRLTVVLDWLLDANHAALFAAKASGAFQRAGLEVDLVAPADPDSPCRLVAAGKADVAIAYGTQINMIVSAGLPLLRIATLIDRPLNTVSALAGGPIHTLVDLKGRKVGLSVGGVEEALLDAMLQSVGLRAADLNLIKVNYDMVTALVDGRLDAAVGAFRNVEVLELRQMGHPPVVFRPEDYGVPLYDELILVARADRRGDPRLARLLSALKAGTQVLLKDPEAMWRIFAAAHPELATPLNHASWIATMPAIAPDPAALDDARYLAFQAFALKHGVIAKALPLDRFAVQIMA
ncbi:MAG: ABC transporter substrate-binding protein [Caulobacteraceae bacterium]|nr:ABC transporter substrate-binding protein [Caulobacteraceae bacterium]